MGYFSGSAYRWKSITKPAAVARNFLAIAVFTLFARLAHQLDEMPIQPRRSSLDRTAMRLCVVLGCSILEFSPRKNEPPVSEDATGLGDFTWPITLITGPRIRNIRNQALPHWSFVVVTHVRPRY
nr:Protein of uncharacterised function (DUF3054) [Streptococcus thermophilus]